MDKDAIVDLQFERGGMIIDLQYDRIGILLNRSQIWKSTSIDPNPNHWGWKIVWTHHGHKYANYQYGISQMVDQVATETRMRLAIEEGKYEYYTNPDITITTH